VSGYLTDTIRSRSFSLPQRLEPARASWLCFAPHPPIGFWPSELFPRGRPEHLSMPVALLPFRPARVSFEFPRGPPSPLPASTSSQPFAGRSLPPRFARATPTKSSSISPNPARRSGPRSCERLEPPTGHARERTKRLLPDLRKAVWSRFRQACAYDFKALLRPRVRSRTASY